MDEGEDRLLMAPPAGLYENKFQYCNPPSGSRNEPQACFSNLMKLIFVLKQKDVDNFKANPGVWKAYLNPKIRRSIDHS